jgi:2-polyprenyl-6-hydroxyphenyl methylase/3-demethylubiquinone-9 3-methyltransferase
MTQDTFVEYYEKQSALEQTHENFRRLRDLLIRVHTKASLNRRLRVADIGCGAGTFSRLWAEVGAEVSGIDVNESLIELARERSKSSEQQIDFHVGSAESLPWPSNYFDIVAMPELLEHVPAWRECLYEAARVLRGGGVLYLSTTNRLCPIQQEFALPGYSWYPRWLKEHCVRLATTTRPEWAGHAKFPAVNWFDPYLLGAELDEMGFCALDRFALLAGYSLDARKRAVGKFFARVPPVRFLGHALSRGTIMVGTKRTGGGLV